MWLHNGGGMVSKGLRALSEMDLHHLEINSKFQRMFNPNPNAFGLRKSYPTNGLSLLAYTENCMLRRGFRSTFLSTVALKFDKSCNARKPLKPLWNIQNVNGRFFCYPSEVLVNFCIKTSFLDCRINVLGLTPLNQK